MTNKDVLTKVGCVRRRLESENAAPDRDEAQALLECLWVFEEHRLPNLDLLRKTFQAEEPRVRAAAIRTLGHWGGRIDDWEDTLIAAARDDSALVRAEAVKAAVEFTGATAAEAIFEAATRPLDPEMNTVLKYAKDRIDVDALVKDIVKSGRKLSPAAQAYMLQNASASDLLQLERSDAVYVAILSRANIPTRFRAEAIDALAKNNRRSATMELITRIQEAEENNYGSVSDLALMLSAADPDQLVENAAAIEQLVKSTQSSAVRTSGYAAWIRAGGSQAAWDHASAAANTLGDLLDSLTQLESSDATETLYASIRPLMFELPAHLNPERGGGVVSSSAPAVAFEYYEPNPAQNVALETLAKASPKIEGRLKNFGKYVPNGRQDAFATKQSAAVYIPQAGNYTFFTASDDGSRLYLDGQLLVDNDGLHGMVEKGGAVQLEAGLHEIVVTYFDNGGGDGLQVSWQGPGIEKQPIPAEALRAAGAADLRAEAIKTIARWPGHFDEKVNDFSALIEADIQAAVALRALATLPAKRVVDRMPKDKIGSILEALISQADQASPVEKQSSDYAQLLELGDLLVSNATGRETLAEKIDSLRASIPERADPKVMALGLEVYSRESHCATCHQPHGQGMPNLYPPLDGSLWATGSEDRLIRIVLDGMHGTIEVKGKTYRSPRFHR